MPDIRFDLPEINTWRLFNKGISQQAVMAMVETWESHGYRFGTVCIDDGWTTCGLLGDWTPDPLRFPDLRKLVDWIHDRGYAVRLWVAPVQMHPGTAVFQQAYPRHVLHNAKGFPACYAGLGTYRIDTRTDLGRRHVEQTMQRLAGDYDVDGFKVDFPPFYLANDEFYKQAGYAFSDYDNETMVSDFYRLVRESLDAVRDDIRVECPLNLPGCQPYVTDVIAGDLVGQSRTNDQLDRTGETLNQYCKQYPIVPWFEMIWGQGSDNPTSSSQWHTGFLEWIGASINYRLKIEHSFLPFEYPNERQIRCLTNLYGPRNATYKVLCAGTRSFSVRQIQQMGTVDPTTRFLVAPQEDTTVVLHTAELGTNALQWRGRDVLTNQSVQLRARNEFWGGTLDWCRVEFNARGLGVYELWHEGPAEAIFRELFDKHNAEES